MTTAGETFEQKLRRSGLRPINGIEDVELPDEIPDAGPDPQALQIAAHVESLRIKRAATRILDSEEHAASWSPPESYGLLTHELALPEVPQQYRVDKVLPAGGNAMLTAQFKAGKTTVINNLVRSLADGVPFLNEFAVTPIEGRVAVFNYEVGADQYRRWMRDVAVENTDKVALLHLRGKRLPLINQHVEDWIVEWLKRNEVQVWIPDPFARAYTGCGDENDNGAVGVFLDTLDVIKERAGVEELIMPVHTGRGEQATGSERARGATRLDDWPDARWLLSKDEENRRFMRFSGRDVEEPEQLLTFDEQTRRLSIGGWDRNTLKKRDLYDAILEYVTANSGCTQNDIKLHTKKDARDIKAVVDAAVRAKKLRTVEGPRNSTLHYLATGTAGLTA